MEAKIDCGEVFLQCFFRRRFGIVFRSIFGGSAFEKSIKTIVFSMVFVKFHNIDVFEKCAKNLRFQVYFRRSKRQKIVTTWC